MQDVLKSRSLPELEQAVEHLDARLHILHVLEEAVEEIFHRVLQLGDVVVEVRHILEPLELGDVQGVIAAEPHLAHHLLEVVPDAMVLQLVLVASRAT